MRSSVRGIDNLFPGTRGVFNDGTLDRNHLRPIDALSPLVAGGVIVATDGYKTAVHPPSVVKSLPAFAPFPRRARHRSFALWWLNEFRHWWKSRYVPTSITYCVCICCGRKTDLSVPRCTPILLQSSFGSIGRALDSGCDRHLHGQDDPCVTRTLQTPQAEAYGEERIPSGENCQEIRPRWTHEVLSQLCPSFYSYPAYRGCCLALDRSRPVSSR